jgi:uncharacterized protein YjiK
MKMRFINIIPIAFVLLLLLQACKDEGETMQPNLDFISRVSIDVPEASGLAVFSDDMFLTVSDSISKIYLVTLAGDVVATLAFSGKNLEGVAYDPGGPVIYVVEENGNEVVTLDTTGMELDRFSVALDNANPRHGLEGITYDPVRDRLYVISEKNPAILFVMTPGGEMIGTHALMFAEDYSSIFYDPHEDLLWILSEDSETLTKTTLEGVPLETYNTSIKRGEGVIVDSKASRVYIITDTESSFFTMGL